MIDLIIKDIIPEAKDYERAEGLKFKKGPSKELRKNEYPYEINGETMANAITDPVKLVRRAKAVVATYGLKKDIETDDYIWRPFYKALFKMGFNLKQVVDIERFKKAN